MSKIKSKAKNLLKRINFDSRKGTALGMVALMAVAGAGYAQFHRTTGDTGFGYGYGYGYGYEDGYGYGYGYHASEGKDDYGYLYSNRLPTSGVTGVSRTGATVEASVEYNSLARLEYGTTSGSYAEDIEVSDEPAHWMKSHAFILDGELACGTTYYYQVTAIDIAGNEWSEDEQSFNTSACSTGGGGGPSPTPDDPDDPDDPDPDPEVPEDPEERKEYFDEKAEENKKRAENLKEDKEGLDRLEQLTNRLLDFIEGREDEEEYREALEEVLKKIEELKERVEEEQEEAEKRRELFDRRERLTRMETLMSTLWEAAEGNEEALAVLVEAEEKIKELMERVEEELIGS